MTRVEYANRRARVLQMLRAGHFIQDIQRAVGVSETVIRRVADFYLLAAHRRPKPCHAHAQGVLVMDPGRHGKRGFRMPFVRIPSTACRAAGWEPGQKLTFQVTGDTLTLRPQKDQVPA